MQKDAFNFQTIFRSFLNAFNIERGFIPTLRDLLIRPKQVVDYYIAGNRGKYFNPGRFFATIFAIVAVLYFIFSTEDIQKKQLGVDKQNSLTEFVKSKDELKELDNKHLNDFQKKLETDKELEDTAILTKMFSESVLNLKYKYPILMYLFIFISLSLVSRLVFYNHHYNLAKHFVTWTYCYCFLLLPFVLIDCVRFYNNINLVSLQYIGMFLYFTYIGRNIFKSNWIYAIIKTAILMTTIFISLMIVLIGFSLISDPAIIDFLKDRYVILEE